MHKMNPQRPPEGHLPGGGNYVKMPTLCNPGDGSDVKMHTFCNPGGGGYVKMHTFLWPGDQTTINTDKNGPRTFRSVYPSAAKRRFLLFFAFCNSFYDVFEGSKSNGKHM